MAAKEIQFPWRWNGGTILSNLDVIWGMSVKYAAEYHGDTEIVSRTVEGPIHRHIYQDAYTRTKKLANALRRLGAGVPMRSPDGSSVMAFNCGGPWFLFTRDKLEDDLGPRLLNMVRGIEAALARSPDFGEPGRQAPQ